MQATSTQILLNSIEDNLFCLILTLSLFFKIRKPFAVMQYLRLRHSYHDFLERRISEETRTTPLANDSAALLYTAAISKIKKKLSRKHMDHGVFNKLPQPTYNLALKEGVLQDFLKIAATELTSLDISRGNRKRLYSFFSGITMSMHCLEVLKKRELWRALLPLAWRYLNRKKMSEFSSFYHYYYYY